MNPEERQILEAMEAEYAQSDAAFAARMSAGPRLSSAQRVRLALATALGVFLVMLFPVNLVFAVIGYLVLVAAGTEVLRHHRFTPAEESPRETFHRLTAGLFRSSDDQAEIAE
jgi:hypothetical protein